MPRDPALSPRPDAETRLAEAAGHRDELRLWLRLLTCTHLIESAVRSRLRARFGVTLPRFDLMAQLEKSPEGLTLGDLSRRMMVSNGNITGLVERLVESGHIERLPNPADRRVAYVRLTEAGHLAFAEMAAEHAGWIGELYAGVPAERQAALLRLLGELKEAVRAAVAEGEGP